MIEFKAEPRHLFMWELKPENLEPPMPLFHFNIADRVSEPDLEGTELPDEDSARQQGIVFAGEYLRDNPELIMDGHVFRVEVTDDVGTPIVTVRIDLVDKRRPNLA